MPYGLEQLPLKAQVSGSHCKIEQLKSLLCYHKVPWSSFIAIPAFQEVLQTRLPSHQSGF